jgi:hypothetical protein
MPNTYPQGKTVHLSTTIRNEAGAPVDPSTITATVRAPDGTETTYSGGQVTRDSLGVYHVDVVLSQAGPWVYRFDSTSPDTAGEATLFASRKEA